MSLSLSNFIEFCWNPFSKNCRRWKNQVKIFVNLYFSDFKPCFLLFGGLCSKCPFYKKKSFLREDFFKTNLDLSRHPQQVFWIFLPFFKYLLFIFVFIWVIWELRELCLKFWNSMIKIHGEIISQSWPLLTLFYSGPIVDWCCKLIFWYWWYHKVGFVLPGFICCTLNLAIRRTEICSSHATTGRESSV